MAKLTNDSNNQTYIYHQLWMTLKMTSAQVVETSVIVNNNSSFQNYTNPDDHTQQTTDAKSFGTRNKYKEGKWVGKLQSVLVLLLIG